MTAGFAGQVAVVTGAASGIGAALARALAARHCHLALVDRQAGAVQSLADALAHSGVRISQHVCDLRQPQAPALLAEQVMQVHPGVHLLINNAGVASIGPFAQQSAAEFDALWAVNFAAVVGLTRAFLPHLLSQPRAHIVNLSSVFGLVAPPGQAAYAASKFAVRGFSHALREELRASPVRVMVVHPGGVDTAIAQQALAGGVSAEQAGRERRRFERLPKMSAQAAAAGILRGIERGQARLVLGWDARLLDLLQRCLPQAHAPLLSWLMRWDERGARGGRGDPARDQRSAPSAPCGPEEGGRG